MQIKSKRETLLEGLQSVAITTSKAILPILPNVLITARENKLTLIATDLELSIKNQLEVEVLKEGSICLPFKTLIAILNKLEKNADVLIEVKKNNQATISSNNAVFHLFGLPEKDFPTFPTYKAENSFVIPSTLFKEMVNKTIFSVSVDIYRYVLNGVFFVAQGDECKMVATDGYRLAFIKKILPTEISEESKVIIPTKALTEINRIIPENKNIDIFLNKDKIVFQTDNLIIVSKLIEGEFPDYRVLIPKDQDKILTVNTQKFFSACRRISLMTSNKINAIKFDVSKNILNLSSNMPDLGNAEEKLEVNFQGDDIQIVLNPKYIMDVLKNIEAKEINILLRSSSTAGMIKPAHEKEQEEYLCVIMPVRI